MTARPSQQEDENSTIHFRVVDTGKTLIRQRSFRPWHPKVFQLHTPIICGAVHACHPSCVRKGIRKVDGQVLSCRWATFLARHVK
jgi:hypothetical protein